MTTKQALVGISTIYRSCYRTYEELCAIRSLSKKYFIDAFHMLIHLFLNLYPELKANQKSILWKSPRVIRSLLIHHSQLSIASRSSRRSMEPLFPFPESTSQEPEKPSSIKEQTTRDTCMLGFLLPVVWKFLLKSLPVLSFLIEWMAAKATHAETNEWWFHESFFPSPRKPFIIGDRTAQWLLSVKRKKIVYHQNHRNFIGTLSLNFMGSHGSRILYII